MKQPDISIILVSMRENLLNKRILDIESSTTCNYEIVVVSPFVVKGKDVIHIPEPNPCGSVDAANMAYKSASAEIIFCLNDEMIPLSGTIDKSLEFMADKIGEPILADPLCAFGHNNVYGVRFCGAPTFSKESIIKHLGGVFFDPIFNAFCADPDLGLRMHSVGGATIDIPGCLWSLTDHLQKNDLARLNNVKKYARTDIEKFSKKWESIYGICPWFDHPDYIQDSNYMTDFTE